MHHALEIEEILLNIFGRCRLPAWQSPTSDLPALARTCRTFKEPALDLLWEELYSPSPLAQCLPDASRQLTPMRKYVFIRPLTQSEGDILRSYTRRIRVLEDSGVGLDWISVGTYLNHPAIEPLFPNLRHLRGHFVPDNMHLLQLPLPSLVSLTFVGVRTENLPTFENSLESFPEFAPNTKSLHIGVCLPSNVRFNTYFSGYICRWRNLEHVICPRIALDLGTLVHLSRAPALTRLAFKQSATLPDQIASSGSPLVFSNLRHLELRSQSWASMLRLLSQTQLPVITYLSASIGEYTSKQNLSSFWITLRTSNVGHTIQELKLVQMYSSCDGPIPNDAKLLLGFKDLQPCRAFRNLRRIDFDILCNESLTKSDVLALSLACPRLEHLVIHHKMIIGIPRTDRDLFDGVPPSYSIGLLPDFGWSSHCGF